MATTGTLEITIVSASISPYITFEAELADIYVAVKCGTEKRSTRIVKEQGRLPLWNESLTFKLDEDDMSKEIKLQVFNVNSAGEQLLGVARVPMFTITGPQDSASFDVVSPTKGEIGNLKANWVWKPAFKGQYEVPVSHGNVYEYSAHNSPAPVYAKGIHDSPHNLDSVHTGMSNLSMDTRNSPAAYPQSGAPAAYPDGGYPPSSHPTGNAYPPRSDSPYPDGSYPPSTHSTGGSYPPAPAQTASYPPHPDATTDRGFAGQPYGAYPPPGGYPPSPYPHPPAASGYPPQGPSYPPAASGYPPQGPPYYPQPGGYAPSSYHAEKVKTDKGKDKKDKDKKDKKNKDKKDKDKKDKDKLHGAAYPHAPAGSYPQSPYPPAGYPMAGPPVNHGYPPQGYPPANHGYPAPPAPAPYGYPQAPYASGPGYPPVGHGAYSSKPSKDGHDGKHKEEKSKKKK